jgi:hypothetical protein
MFVDRLLGRTVSGTSPARRIESLRLLGPTEQQTRDLEAFIRSSATKPLLPALADLSDKRHLWVNNLHVEGAAQAIQNIELLSWRTNTDKIAKWSGLEEGEGGAPPVLILQRDADRTGDYSKLEVKWKARPENLKEGAVEYRVAIITDMDEELACREVTHSGKKDEKCRFWESDQPIVIRIHTTQNDNLQKAFASLVFYGLYKEMFRRGLQDHITHAVVFDEAHRAAGLKLIPIMAKECRKYGISLVVASQEAKDFNVSLFSAIANYLVLRLTEADARALARNVSSSQQERVLVDKIKQMDRFRALYFCEGKSRPSLVALSS